ncbi:MAG: hypothetical protein ACI35W_01125 [Anaeroplasmataceae bacterium]
MSNKAKKLLIFSVLGVVIVLIIAGITIYLSVNKSSEKLNTNEKIFLNSEVALYNEALGNTFIMPDTVDEYSLAVNDINGHIKALELLMISYNFTYKINETTDYDKSLTLTYYGINNIKYKYDVNYNVNSTAMVGKIKLDGYSEYEFVSKLLSDNTCETAMTISKDEYKCITKDNTFRLTKNNNLLSEITIGKTNIITTNVSSYTCYITNGNLKINVKYSTLDTVMTVTVNQVDNTYEYTFKEKEEKYSARR